MKYFIAVCLMFSLVGCGGGEVSRARSSASFSDSGLAPICYQGVTYLVTAKGGVTVQLSPDNNVVPCTP